MGWGPTPLSHLDRFNGDISMLLVLKKLFRLDSFLTDSAASPDTYGFSSNAIDS